MRALQTEAGKDQANGGEEGAATEPLIAGQRGNPKMLAQCLVQGGILPFSTDDGRNFAVDERLAQFSIEMVMAQPVPAL